MLKYMLKRLENKTKLLIIIVSHSCLELLRVTQLLLKRWLGRQDDPQPIFVKLFILLVFVFIT